MIANSLLVNTIFRFIKLITLSYYAHAVGETHAHIIAKCRAGDGYVHHLDSDIQVQVIYHAHQQAEVIEGNVKYLFFPGINKFFFTPAATHQYIKQQQPDVVIVHGFIYSLQLSHLRGILGKDVKIIIQHHAEFPFSHPMKRYYQKKAAKKSDAFLFTAMGNAKEWLQAGIIKDATKCYEILEGTTTFKPTLGKQLTGTPSFLWVGRLNDNKDPLTVLNAFKAYIRTQPAAHLYIIYQEDDLLPEIKSLLATDAALQSAVTLVGKVPNTELSQWYTAANYYISASHKEGSGYALLEAMACGCIPIVTSIPSFTAITNNGEFGHLYTPGDALSLLQVLQQLQPARRDTVSASIMRHFNDKLSFAAIARSMQLVFNKLLNK
jgi:Glycosyltransferase